MNKLILMTFGLITIAAGTRAALGDTLVPRLLAASPAEIESGNLHLPKPEALAVDSPSAVLPLRFARGANGTWIADVEVPIDNPGAVRLMAIGPGMDAWEIAVSAADSAEIRLVSDEPVPGVRVLSGDLGIPSFATRAAAYELANVDTGLLRSRVTSPGPVEGGNLLVKPQGSDVLLRSYIGSHRRLVGEPMLFNAFMFRRSAQRTGETHTPIPGLNQQGAISITRPDGSTVEAELWQVADANVGILQGSFVPDLPGRYTAQITVTGSTMQGPAVLRTVHHVFEVRDRACVLSGTARLTESQDLCEITIGAEVLDEGANVFVSCEIWAGEEALCWTGGMCVLRDASPITLGFDTRWLDQMVDTEKLHLRNTRVQDARTWAVVDEITEITPVTALRDRPRGGERQGADDAMLRGPYAPARAVSSGHRSRQSGARAFGAHNLLLVHGYCAGGNPWPNGDFTGFTEVFADPSQNRSNDEFAWLIGQLGASSKSYGVVAHSQGGCATLHLYSFYWSGLDWATGPRLIQSVGTPYQGTPLAGNVAVLGEIFGAGCGENTDLSVDGAALWLANIPTWARQKVWYWTTSFDDGIFYDYCNLLSDFFLSDPDDGVIERSRGQLPGANNMGHTEGWCHTTGMRDPAQYTDSARNQNMNANAAR